MNVSVFKSGTDAIVYQLACFDVDTVIVPQNLCPEVMKHLSRKYRLILAQVKNHFEPADYASAVPGIGNKTAILYVHPYGSYRERERDRLDHLARVVIDDCCLCDPDTIINKYMLEGRRYVFSFGYSKVLDIGGGGLLISPEWREQGRDTIVLPYNLYNVQVPKGSAPSGFLSLSEFLEAPFFSWLNKVSDARTTHRRAISDIYFFYLNDTLEILDSPWRMIVKAPPELYADLNNMLKSNDLDLFIGLNYPLLEYCNGRFDIKSSLDGYNTVPLNLFHDFRFDTVRAKLLGKIIQGVLM